jgi:hypothetical protein
MEPRVVTDGCRRTDPGMDACRCRLRVEPVELFDRALLDRARRRQGIPAMLGKRCSLS